MPVRCTEYSDSRIAFQADIMVKPDLLASRDSPPVELCDCTTAHTIEVLTTCTAKHPGLDISNLPLAEAKEPAMAGD